MGKFRVRCKNAKKGIRWAKGQSSSSNPVKTKHRDAAKTKSLSKPRGDSLWGPGSGEVPSKLTLESLLKHDVLMDENQDMADVEGETLAQTNKTFETFASDWTQCTNISFNRIIRRFDAYNPQHKESLAILAAVTEVIKANGGEESSTEYFSALLTTLEAVDTLESLSATLTLMTMVIKTVPTEVLQKHFGVSKLLLDNLVKHGGMDNSDSNSSVVRSLIGCISIMLRAQSGEKWSQSSTTQIYKAILEFCVHPKPKIRKSAQHAICAILKGSFVMAPTSEIASEMEETENVPDFHPVSGITAQFCLDRLNMQELPVTVLHTLVLLKEIIPCFKGNDIKSLADATLSLLQSKTHPHMNSCVMQMFYGLFNSRPSSQTLNATVNAKMVSALHNFKPSVNDSKDMIAWLTVLQEAMINLYYLESRLCLAHMPNFFNEVKKCWTSDKPEVRSATTVAMKAILNECLQPIMQEISEGDKEEREKVLKVIDHVHDGLGFQYHGAWSQVLQALAVLFEVLGPLYPTQMKKILITLDERRGGQNFAFINELDYVVGRAVRKLGPELVLKALDLCITGDETSYDFPRSWLLPILRENIQNTDLRFFIEYFKPLAEKCKLRSIKCQEKDDKIGFKTFEVLDFQIWSLLPGFCNQPRDLASCFKLIAKTMGDVLMHRKELRLDILASIRHLISRNLENEENRKILALYAKNFLPLLCNLYITEPKGSEEIGQRLAVFETIKSYAQIAEDRLPIMFDAAFNSYLEESGFVKESSLDILKAYLPYQDVKRIQKLFDHMISLVSSSDHKEQKKAYKVIETICMSESQACKDFLTQAVDVNKEDNLQDSLLKSLSKASPSSQASRMKCLIHILRQFDGNKSSHLKFVKKIIPEAILCIKAVNEKARSGAYELLIVIGEALIRWEGDSKKATGELLTMISAGLAGTPALTHCTLLAMTKVFFEFHDIISNTMQDILVVNVCNLLSSNNREVIGAALSFLRVFMAVASVLKSGKHLETIVGAVVTIENQCQRHFRLKIKYLLDKIIRKFGYDLVFSIVNNKIRSDDKAIFMKRLKNIKKEQNRKQRKREEQNGHNESDEEDYQFKVNSKPKTMEDILAESDSELEDLDDDDGKKKQNQMRKKTKKTKTFITEDGEDIVDFLDPKAAQMITSVKPKTKQELEKDMERKKNQDKNGGFKLNEDGKLLIVDSEDEDGKERKKSSDKMDFVAENSDEELEDEFKTLVASNRKRKMNGGSIASQKSSITYRSGGTGIHRPVKKAKTDSTFGSEYRSSKARGDVKRAGKPDPYAYVPLWKSNLNKRKRGKDKGQFKNIVRPSKARV